MLRTAISLKEEKEQQFAIQMLVNLSKQEIDYANHLSKQSSPDGRTDSVQHGIKLALWQHNHFQDNLKGFTEALDELCKDLSKKEIAKTIVPFVEKLKKLDQ